MSSIVDIYSKEVHNNFKPLYANWDPGQPIDLGAYGLLVDEVFTRIGNVSHWGVKNIVDIPQGGTDQLSFSSKGSTSISFNAAGTVNVAGIVNAKPSLKIDFKSENSVFFNAAGCKHHMIDDKNALADSIMALYTGGKGKWKREWVVVTDYIEADSATIVVSGGNSSSIELEATADVPRIDLADAKLGLAIKAATNIGYQLVKLSDDGSLKPLIGFSRIQSKWFWSSDTFNPLSRTLANATIVKSLETEPSFKTERDPKKDLFFGQVKD
jgi:hypothetical protein